MYKISHWPVAQVRVSPSSPGYPRREGASSRQADFLSMVSIGHDIMKRHFVCTFFFFFFTGIVYLFGNEKKQPSLSAGAATFVQWGGGMGCEGSVWCAQI